MSLWYFDILGYVDWVLNPLEKLLFYEMNFEIYVFKKLVKEYGHWGISQISA